LEGVGDKDLSKLTRDDALTRNGPAGACPLVAITCRVSVRSKISRASARTAAPSGVISMDRVVHNPDEGGQVRHAQKFVHFLQ
jgi:hypothetical protein